MQDIVGETGAVFSQAGTLRNGRTFWAVADLPENLIVRGDEVARHLLMRTSHNGTSALQVTLIARRLACENMLSGTFENAQNTFSIRHTLSAPSRANDARRTLGIADKYFAAFGEGLRTLADLNLENADVSEILNKLVPDPKESKSNTRAREARSRIAWLYASGQPGARSEACHRTGYGLWNAMADYADHSRTVRTSRGRHVYEARMESTLWGSAARFKERGARLILEHAGAATANEPVDRFDPEWN